MNKDDKDLHISFQGFTFLRLVDLFLRAVTINQSCVRPVVTAEAKRNYK